MPAPFRSLSVACYATVPPRVPSWILTLHREPYADGGGADINSSDAAGAMGNEQAADERGESRQTLASAQTFLYLAECLFTSYPCASSNTG